MPTPSEQKALAFIAIIALLGGAVRVVRANSAPTPTAAEQQGLARQATAAESASTRAKAAKKGRGRPHIDSVPRVVGGVASVPPTFARPDQPYARSPYGYPPPGPRIDIDNRTPRAAAAPGAPTIAGQSAKIDLDIATEAEIEKLPRIGPAMAKKIVANRDSLGPFKALENLRRVKGLGPATLKLLSDLVEFSGRRPLAQ